MEWECCWSRGEVTSTECPYIAEGEEELYTAHKKRFVEKCLDCPRFRNDLQKFRDSGHPFAEVLRLVTAELLDQKGRLQSMGSFLSSKTREIRFLHELNLVLQTSLDLDEVLSVAMTAITAGKGFGLNRALLLMTDKERQSLKGYLGVGPRTYDEAWQIWQEIGESDLNLRDLAKNFQKNKLLSEKVKFHDLLEKLTVPLTDQTHIFNRALREKKPILVTQAFDNPEIDPDLAMLLGVDSFLVMPLISRNRRIGVIIADNCITHKPIAPQDIQLLETFTFPVAFALERASLYERLQEEVDKLTEANAKLKEQQELILRMEKMALIGQITSSLAHSIRNPLTIIGGLARSLLKTVAKDDRNRGYLESIVNEAKQFEDAFKEVLNYADGLHPAVDAWDVNQLVTGVLDQVRENLGLHGITCTFRCGENLPLAFVDYNQIAFCVRVLLNSTMESTGTDRVSLTTRRDGETVDIIIEENGAGATVGLTRQGNVTSPILPLPPGNFGLLLCTTILEKQVNPFIIETLPEGGTRYTIRLPIRKEIA